MRVVLVAVLLVGGIALADIPPPDTSGCSSKVAGDACKKDDGASGVCATSTCTRNDYSGGVPPKSVSYECLRCGDAPAGTKKSGCAAVPSLSALALLLAFLSRRRS